MAKTKNNPPLKYLVLEGDSQLNHNTKKFFEKRKKAGEKLEYVLIDPSKEHQIVTNAIYGHGTSNPDFLLFEPTIYRHTLLNRFAHDIVHSLRRKNSTTHNFKLKKVFIMDTKENLTRGMIFAGPDAIASVAGVIAAIPVYVLDGNYDPVFIDERQFFQLVRESLYADSNIRFYNESSMGQIVHQINPDILVAKPDLTIPFIMPEREKVIANATVATIEEVISQVGITADHKLYGKGFIDVYHGNKTLVFRPSNREKWDLPEFEYVITRFEKELSVFYPGYNALLV